MTPPNDAPARSGDGSHCQVTVRTAMVVAMSLFLLAWAGSAVGLFILTERSIRAAAYETGKARLAEAYEYDYLRLKAVETKAEQMEGFARLDRVDQKVSDQTTALNYFNSTLSAQFVTETVLEPRALGYGLSFYFPDSTIQYFLTYYDVLEDGSHEYVLSNIIPGTNTSTADTFAYSKKRGRIENRTYLYDWENTPSYYEDSFLYPVPWWRATLWYSGDGSVYHYFTYSRVCEAFNGVLWGIDIWLEASEILTSLSLPTASDGNEILMLVDDLGRVVATSEPAYNRQYLDQIKEAVAVETESYDIHWSELGDHYPVPYVRKLYQQVQHLMQFDRTDAWQGKEAVKVDGTTYLVATRSLYSEDAVHIALVWARSEKSLVGALRRDMLAVEITLMLFMLALFIIFGVLSYRSFVAPLRQLDSMMLDLSELRLDDVAAYDDQGPYVVEEVNSLYASYRWVKNTTVLCVPYLPDIATEDSAPIISIRKKSVDHLSDVSESTSSDRPSPAGSCSHTSVPDGSVHSTRSASGTAHESFNVSTSVRPSGSRKRSSAVHKEKYAPTLPESLSTTANELVSGEIVIAHFELHEDFAPETMDRIVWRALMTAFQTAACKAISANKGTIVHIGVSSVVGGWHRLVNQELKACTAGLQFIQNFDEVLPQRNRPKVGLPATVGVASSAGLSGVTGTTLKKNFICDGKATDMSALLAKVGHKVCAGVVSSQKVNDRAKMFAKFRVAEMLRLPNAVTERSLKAPAAPTLVTKPVFQCVSLQTESEDEWMYVLDEREIADKSNPFDTAFQSLVKGDLPKARAQFQKIAEQTVTADPFIAHKCQLLGVAPPMTSPGESLNTKPPELPESVATFFEEVSTGQREFSREATVRALEPLPLDP